MKREEINIRDPYVLLHGDTYYLYGTRSESCWGECDGFDCYHSCDLVSWEGPVEVFHRPKGFFADRNYWAPEVYCHDGSFYMLTTFGCDERKKGVYLLRANNPLGPFEALGDKPLTPPDWACIDGSLYFDGAQEPWLIFSHSFEDEPRGDMCAVRLSADLSKALSEPCLLFSAADAPWARPVPFAKAEFGMDGDVYFTDGPCMRKMEDGSLICLWASWSERGYAVGAAQSKSGDITGPWKHLPEKVFPENGGHGMLFEDKSGQLFYTLHYPNDKYMERPIFRRVEIKDDRLILADR